MRQSKACPIFTNDLYLCLASDGDFYRKFLEPIYKSMDTAFIRGKLHVDVYASRVSQAINTFTKTTPACSYHQKHVFISTADRFEVANRFIKERLNELKFGNFIINVGPFKGDPNPRIFRSYVLSDHQAKKLGLIT